MPIELPGYTQPRALYTHSIRICSSLATGMKGGESEVKAGLVGNRKKERPNSKKTFSLLIQ